MAKPAARILFLEAVLAVAGGAVLVRGFTVQVLQHRQWAARAEALRTETVPIPARRGTIYDRNGVVLAESQPQYRVGIALDQLRDTAAIERRLPALLDISPERVARAFRKNYAFFYGPFSAAQVEPLREVRGVHLDVLYVRAYPMQALAAPILGHLGPEGDSGVGGLERTLDTVLAGDPGLDRYTIDSHGDRLAIPNARLRDPVPGHDVYLTIDHDLQGIAESALRQAVDADGARGGDVVIADARTGELWAVASLRTDSSTGVLAATASALVEPFEPGSTSKLFTAAALLTQHADTSPVYGENGHWKMPVGHNRTRTIDDVDKLDGPVTLGSAIAHSSNIAMSKFSQRITPDAQFETIRNFGFGTAPGLGFPGEAPGRLPRPATWANPLYTQPSLAMGYEWMTSAVQLAAAYGAIADSGRLLAPSLVRAIRDGAGDITWQHQPGRGAPGDLAVSVASQLISYLAMVTDSGGTGTGAQLDRLQGDREDRHGRGQLRQRRAWRRVPFVIRRRLSGGRSALDRLRDDRPAPRCPVFGGKVAAPVVKSILQQALALEHPPIDLGHAPALAAADVPAPRGAPPRQPMSVAEVAYPLQAAADTTTERRAVPTVVDLPVRQATMALHEVGFQVRLVGRGTVRRTDPMPGDTLVRGATVTVRGRHDAMKTPRTAPLAPPPGPGGHAPGRGCGDHLARRRFARGEARGAVPRDARRADRRARLHSARRGGRCRRGVRRARRSAGVPVVVVQDGRRAAQAIAEQWYGYPAHELGSSASPAPTARPPPPRLVRHLLNDQSRRGSIGTLGAFDGAGARSSRRAPGR